MKDFLGNPKVSIIVPVYNVEKYLAKCLDSLINQTLEDIEIIVVNDGSKDNSEKIIQEFCKHDSRIKLINQENAGQAAARNRGIIEAKSEYISFIDSDDWIDKNFLEKLYLSATNNNCDIAAATIIRKGEHFQKYRVYYTEEKIVESLEDKIKTCDIPTCCYVWNKLYKKSLLENSLFPVGKFYEDILWIPEIIKKANKLVTVPNTNYYYRVNRNSTVKKVQSLKKQKDSYDAKKYIIKFFNDNNLELSEKHKRVTKKIYYLGNIPVFKIKEKNNKNFYYLFNFLPIYINFSRENQVNNA